MLKIEFENKDNWRIEGAAPDLMALALLLRKVAGQEGTTRDAHNVPYKLERKGTGPPPDQKTQFNYDGQIISVTIARGDSASAL